MKKVLIAVCGVFAVGILIACGIYSQASLESRLPPKEVFTTPALASEAADAYAALHGGSVGLVAGTGSMVPYIRAAREGELTSSVVAFFVTDARRSYVDIKVGDLCTYSPESVPGQTAVWIHVAAQKDKNGWIMSGLANKRSESWQRVTPANFRAIVARVFTWE